MEPLLFVGKAIRTAAPEPPFVMLLPDDDARPGTIRLLVDTRVSSPPPFKNQLGLAAVKSWSASYANGSYTYKTCGVMIEMLATELVTAPPALVTTSVYCPTLPGCTFATA